ncbi:hypothetical protein GIB67_022500, partial [Kingdonia uniflora]
AQSVSEIRSVADDEVLQTQTSTLQMLMLFNKEYWLSFISKAQYEVAYYEVDHWDREMSFNRDHSRFVFDCFKDLCFMEKAQYEINNYGTEKDNIKMSSLRNLWRNAFRNSNGMSPINIKEF